MTKRRKESAEKKMRMYTIWSTIWQVETLRNKQKI